MKLSDLSIKRPVLAVVMSLLLIVLGVMSYLRLTLRELPAIDPPIVCRRIAAAAAWGSDHQVTAEQHLALQMVESLWIGCTIDWLNGRLTAEAADVRWTDAHGGVVGQS